MVTDGVMSECKVQANVEYRLWNSCGFMDVHAIRALGRISSRLC